MSKQQYPNSLLELIAFLSDQGVPKTEHWKYIGQFLERKSRKLQIPIHGKFELTPLCNFDCKMCYIHLSDRNFDRRKLLTINQWKQLAGAASEMGMHDVSLTGGECLTYPDFDELYEYLISLKQKVYIMSNGYFMDDKYIKLFKSFEPAIIQISLYGSSEDAYEAVTGVRAYSKVYNNIVRIRDAGLPLKLAITPSSFMRGDIEPLIRLAESLHIKYGVNSQLMAPRENTGRTKSDLTTDEYISIYHLLSSINQEEHKAIDHSLIPEENHEGVQRYGLRCGAGSSSFGIKYDGSMCPCLSLEEITVKPLEVGFQQAWKYINDRSRNYALPLECGDCVYSKQCMGCVAIHKDAPKTGHCDPEVCKRMKRLVQEGFVPLQKICNS